MITNTVGTTDKVVLNPIVRSIKDSLKNIDLSQTEMAHVFVLAAKNFMAEGEWNYKQRRVLGNLTLFVDHFLCGITVVEFLAVEEAQLLDLLRENPKMKHTLSYVRFILKRLRN